MKTQIAPRNTRPVSRSRNIVGQELAYVRLAAAIVEAPEEVLLAVLLANRSKFEANPKTGSN